MSGKRSLQREDKHDESKQKIQKLDEQKSRHKTDKHDESKPKIHKEGEQKPEHKTDKHDGSKPKIHKEDKQKADKHDEQKQVGKSTKEQSQDTIEFQGDMYKFVSIKQLICHVCAKHIKSSSYHCEAKGWDMHPYCSKLKTHVKDDKTSYTLVETNEQCRIPCSWCKTKNNNSGLSYVSARKDHRFHVYCFMELMVKKEGRNARKGLKREAFLEEVLSLTNIFREGFLGDMTSIFELMSGWV